MVALALYQPDIPQNTGTLLRLGACLGVPVHVIEPAGFALTDRAFRRAGLDYLDRADIVMHASFAAFREAMAAHRIVVVETTGTMAYTAFDFSPQDVLLLGRETSGVPDHVVAACAASVAIPMRAGFRSLNVAVAGAMVLGEALRATGQWPKHR
jgi:tRNA (cytidine/uridine-2'-O-)-methyltransferase